MRYLKSATLLAVICILPSFATSVLQLNLGDIVQRSENIFIGTCVDVKAVDVALKNGHIPATEYTFEIEQGLKGAATKTNRYTFRVVGRYGKNIEPAKNTTYQIDGMPSYIPGERYVLFMTQPSELGLSVPVGLMQGSFEIHKADDQRFMVSNGVRNAGLLSNMQPQFKNSPFERVFMTLQRDADGTAQAKFNAVPAQAGGPMSLEDLVGMVEYLQKQGGR